jgi:fructokinase
VRIGIDLGGSKIEGAVMDDTGQLRERLRVPTPQGDYQATLQAIAQLVENLESTTAKGQSIGICTPGAISPANHLLRNANSVCLNGQPVLEDLQQVLQRPVLIANDADCFALSEASDGAAAQAHTVFGVIIGTGVGGGIVVNGELLNGPNAIAGEWGHNPLPWPTENETPGPDCYCGKQGCIETYLSGPGLSKDHGGNLTAQQIIQLTEQGHEGAQTTMQRYYDRMARALASVINVLDPDIIVLGGGLSNIKRLYQTVPELLPRYVFSDVVHTCLMPPKYGDSSGVRGAAWLWR